MQRDKLKIQEIINNFGQDVIDTGGMNTPYFVKLITDYINQERTQSFGWMYAEACILQDNFEDLRTKNVGELLNEAMSQLGSHIDPNQ